MTLVKEFNFFINVHQLFLFFINKINSFFHMNPKIPKFLDSEVLSNVLPYLNFADLSKVSLLSKELNYNLRKYLRENVLPK